jgi:hypothetical protein
MENLGGFVLADHPELSEYIPSSINDRGGVCSSTLRHDNYIQAVEPSVGQYFVGYPNLGDVTAPKAVHTTAYGSSAANFCRLGSEAFRLGADPALRTQVNCYDSSGNRTDSKFAQLALVNATASCP